jgi:hypothetical protein
MGVTGLTLGLAACVPPAAPPPSAPPPVAPPAEPALPPPAPASWEQAPVTPGNWSYARSAGGSTATFGSASSGAPLSVRCETAARRIVISRQGLSPAAVPTLVIRTTFSAVTLPATITPQAVEAARPATDPLFDQIAFSRGRFAVEGAGLPRIIAPPWAEISRVIEDCRG